MKKSKIEITKDDFGGFVKPDVQMLEDVSEVVIKSSAFDKVKELEKEIFNIKFNYDTLLNFTCQLLSHEQHVKFAAKKKEIFG